MDTAPYLSVCLNTLNLPFILNNPDHPVTKYLQGLRMIPAEMKLPNGYPLRLHIELLAEANPAQKYLLSKQGYSLQELKGAWYTFQNSKGYVDLRNEYKAVGADFRRPHRFLSAPVPPPPEPVKPETPPLPETLIEQPPPPTTQPAQLADRDQKISSQGEARPSSTASQSSYTTSSHTPHVETPKPTPPTPTIPPTREPVPHPELPTVRRAQVLPRSRIIPPPPTQAIPRPPQPVLPTPNRQRVDVPGQGQVRPNRIIPPLSTPSPIRSGVLNASSGIQRVVQRAANVTIPQVLGGFLKTTGSSFISFIPGVSSGGSSRTLLSAGGSGGGRRGFIGQFSPSIGRGGGRSVWWILLLLLLLVVFFIFFFGGIPPLSNSTDIKNIELTKSAPAAVENGGKIVYNIAVRNKGTKPAQIVVTDDVPQNTTYDGGNNDPVASDSGKVVRNLRWTINNLAGGQVQNLTFSVVPTKEDTWIINQAKASVTIAGGGSTGGPVNIPGNIPPTQDNCGGKWTFKTPLGNYGDPQCNFSKDDLFTLLNQLDPANAAYWFYTVVRCESAYDPNNFLGASASGLGAYGLYQMNPSGKGNGQYDAGDVIWQLQSSNAVNYNNQLTRKWRYWACAQDRW